ncbi:MAG: NAD(P)/FAD-dependent oxidoreductase [Streptosporangiaceae bacterium]|nr:NAD(P)/FAD-dependent oxidoreductase [Streptosporangiaceae bacterium]
MSFVGKMGFMVKGGTYDAVVVGGGHNGLVCAAYLARAGLRTVVLERRHLVGGAAVTEEPWPGYRVSTASYVVSLLPERIVRELSLRSLGYHVYPLDPAYFAPFEDGSGILVWEDPRHAAEEIGRISRPDGEAYLRYSRDIAALADVIRPLLHKVPPDPALRSARDLPAAAGMLGYLLRRRGAAAALVDLMTMSCADFLQRYFRDERILGALAPGGVIGMWGGPMSPGSAYVLLHHRMGEVDGVGGCWAVARGGMGAVSEAIAAAARATGATVLTSADVISIDVLGGGRVGGVTLADGRVFSAPVVVSGVHPATTFLSLVGEKHLPGELVDDVRQFRTRSPAAKVNLALSGLPSFTARPGSELGPQHPEFIISPTLEYLERAWDAAKYGMPSPAPMIDCVIPSTKDSSLAPAGAHVMSCFVQYVPYALADGEWTDAARDALASSVISTIERFAPGFGGLVTHREVLTPYDLQERFGLLGGNIFHGEMSADQLFSFRPSPLASGYRTPLRGLYLCGSGTHPGGGVMGIPGRNASRVIVRDARVSSMRRRVVRR